MVFIATFNNFSVISWRSVLLVEETGGSGENHRPVASHWQTLSLWNKTITMVKYTLSQLEPSRKEQNTLGSVSGGVWSKAIKITAGLLAFSWHDINIVSSKSIRYRHTWINMLGMSHALESFLSLDILIMLSIGSKFPKFWIQSFWLILRYNLLI
jgi:hypothetical protein